MPKAKKKTVRPSTKKDSKIAKVVNSKAKSNTPKVVKAKKPEISEAIEKTVISPKIVAAERTLVDLYELGLIRRPSLSKNYDPAGIPAAYFLKLPQSDVVTPETAIGSHMWWAWDFLYEGRRRIFILSRHCPPNEQSPMGQVEAIDEDSIRRSFFYDAVCLIPQKKTVVKKEEKPLPVKPWKKKRKKKV